MQEMGTAARFKERHPTDLLKWMEKNGVTNWELGKHLGCGPMAVEYWKWNQAIPTLVYAIKLERATRGAVTVESWVNTPYGRLQYAKTADWSVIGKSGAQKERERKMRAAAHRPDGGTP